MPTPTLEGPKPGCDLDDLPRCNCGSQIGLLPWNDRYWCCVCLTNEIERLRGIVGLGVKWRRTEVAAGAIQLGMRAGDQEDAARAAQAATRALRMAIDNYNRGTRRDAKQEAAEAGGE